MAGFVTCDWCGHTIEDFSPLSKMLCYGLPDRREWHFHQPSDGYECMERAIEAFDEICGIPRPSPERQLTSREGYQAEHAAWLSRRDAWRGLSATEREHQILNVLRGHKLGCSAIVEKINDQHDDWQLYQDDLKSLLLKMVERGDLDRVKQPRAPGSKQFRWLYSRRPRDLSPELKRLERALNSGNA